ncbi:hypothetical protein MASR2M78_21230 [Treponema sp.]
MRAGLDAKVIRTTQLDMALEGADYVNAQVRVGGLAARITDEKIPLNTVLWGKKQPAWAAS